MRISKRTNEHIKCGQYETKLIIVAKGFGAPAEADIEEHDATHLPHRSWCPVRETVGGKEDAHRVVKNKGDKAVVALDYNKIL